MREMIMRRWCDECWHEGQLQNEASFTYTMGVVQGESRPALKVLELCEDHNKLAVDLMDLLKEIGQLPDFTQAKKTPASSTPAVPQLACPVCGMAMAKTSLIGHVWSKHRTDRRPDQPRNCPTCGEFIDNGTGMSAHRRSSHGFDALADALAGVKGYKP